MSAAPESAPDPAARRCRAHRVVGLLGVLAFLASGLEMHFRYGHLRSFDMATRLSFRSIHIYLLFASLLNLGVSLGARAHEAPWQRRVAVVGSALVLAAPFLLGVAFVTEPLADGAHRTVTSFGVYAAAGGTALLAIAGAPPKRR